MVAREQEEEPVEEKVILLEVYPFQAWQMQVGCFLVYLDEL